MWAESAGATAQVLSFALSSSSALPWRLTMLKAITIVLSSACLRFPSGSSAELSLSASVFVALVAVGFACVGWALLKEKAPQPWLLKVIARRKFLFCIFSSHFAPSLSPCLCAPCGWPVAVT